MGLACNNPTPRSAVRHITSVRESSAKHHFDRWKELWRNREDVFTLEDVNENLIEFESQLLPHASSISAVAKEQGYKGSVLVPLCGRSSDLVWLAHRNYFVIGVDAVPDPLRQWAAENGGVEPLAETDAFSSYRSLRYPNLQLLHGDIFDLNEQSLGMRFDAIWDRAALTSIQPGDRLAYLTLLRQLMHNDGRLIMEFLTCNLDSLDGVIDIKVLQSHLRSAGLNWDILKDENVLPRYAAAPASITQLRELVVKATVGVL
jgi:hypothetical protein